MGSIPKNVLLRSVQVSAAAILCLWAPILVVRLVGNVEMGGLLLILFLISPLISLLAGLVTVLVGGHLWIGLLAMLAAHLVIIFSLFNSSALVYVPVYLLLFLAGYKLPKLIQRFVPVKKVS
jgi:hypothetical protein